MIERVPYPNTRGEVIRNSIGTMPRASRVAIVALVFALGLFLALGAYQLRLPGLHYDEAREAGLNAMQLLIGQPVTAFRDATVQLGSWQLPLMVQDYIGALNVFLALPFLWVGGVNVVALRWLSLLTGAATLVLAWRVADRLGGKVASVVTVGLLAASPTFVFWSRQGIFVTNLTALLFMAGLLSGLRWWSGGRPKDLWLTAFLLGLGVYAKLLFVWAVAALVLVALVGWRLKRLHSSRPPALSPLSPQAPEEHAGTNRHALQAAGGAPDAVGAAPGNQAGSAHQSTVGASNRKRTPAVLATWIVAVICFLVPLIPLALFNLRTGGTLASLFGNLGSSYYGVNNSAYLPNLLVRIRQLPTLLRGDHFWYLGELFADPWAPWLAGGLIVAATIQAVLLWRRKVGPLAHRTPATESSPDRAYAFLLPLALILLVVAQSAFTVSDLFITHYALIYPLIPLVGGLAAAALVDGLQEERERSDGNGGSEGQRSRGMRFLPALVAGAAVLAVVWWAGGDLWTTLRYHKVLSVSGGYSAHSDAVYALAESLDREGASAPLALDWGLQAPVRFLTAGRVNPIEVFGYDRMDAPDAGFAERMSGFLNDRNNLYLAHMPDASVFRGRVDALKALAASKGLALEEQGRFAERSGHPLFVLYRAVPISEGE
jgi:hypothetical protein